MTIAGMPTFFLNDLARMRIEVISFFLFIFFLSSWGVKSLWNRLRTDFPKMPQLTYRKALALVTLWGLMFILVLTMISGARELMTPGAWEKKGATYQLKQQEEQAIKEDQALANERQKKLEELRILLLAYAQAHDGNYPKAGDSVPIPASQWIVPGQIELKYHYQSGLKVNNQQTPLAWEPDAFDDPRWVLMSNGDLAQWDSVKITEWLEENGVKQ